MKFRLFMLGRLFPVFLMGSIFFVSCNSSPKEVKELKVLSWNVWHAGHAENLPEKSCESCKTILKATDPDVITMVETYGCSDDVADHLGYYHRLISSNLSIYSRYPIVKTYTFPDQMSTFKFGGVELDVNGKRVRVFDLWIHYLPDAAQVPSELSEAEIIAWEEEGTRDEEIKAIMEIMKPFIAEADEIPLIIAGDFNTNSHLDWTEATKDCYSHQGAVVNWPVSRIMEENHFIDSFREMHPHPELNETEYGPTWLAGEHRSRSCRIDYIYYQGAGIQTIESQSFNSECLKPFEYQGITDLVFPSDHGFVVSRFSLK